MTRAEVERRLDSYDHGRGRDAVLAFMEWWRAGLVDRETLRAVLFDLWYAFQKGATNFTHRSEWVAMLRAAGFLSRPPQPAPTAPLRVWRGARPGGWRSLSWTADRLVAEWYGRLQEKVGGRGALYEALVEPGDVLAVMGDLEHAGEWCMLQEVFVDPDGLILGENVHEVPFAHGRWVIEVGVIHAPELDIPPPPIP